MLFLLLLPLPVLVLVLIPGPDLNHGLSGIGGGALGTHSNSIRFDAEVAVTRTHRFQVGAGGRGAVGGRRSAVGGHLGDRSAAAGLRGQGSHSAKWQL